MTETSMEQRFQKEAERCRAEAADATNEADRTAWLRMANDWTRLAKEARPAKSSHVRENPPALGCRPAVNSEQVVRNTGPQTQLVLRTS